MASVGLVDIQKKYGRTVALDGIDVEVVDGEFFVLLGHSGAGKTTTLKTIGGLERPSSGRVLINGVDVTDVEPYERNVAMAFENYSLYPQHTVYQNMSFPLRSKRHRVPEKTARERVQRVAETLGIDALLDRMPRELSNGQRQRVALGRVLSRPADVMLLDEPLSHLDAKLRARMRAELRSMGQLDGTTSVYVTHDYLEAVALGDRIGILRDGRLIQVGSREDLWRAPADTFVARALGRPEINLIAGRLVDTPGGRRFRSADGAFEVAAPAAEVGTDAPVILGVRPRVLVVSIDSSASEAGQDIVAGRIYVDERLGRDREITVAVGENRIVALTAADRWPGADADTPVSLRLSSVDTLLFAGDESGRLLSRPATAPVEEGSR